MSKSFIEKKNTLWKWPMPPPPQKKKKMKEQQWSQALSFSFVHRLTGVFSVWCLYQPFLYPFWSGFEAIPSMRVPSTKGTRAKHPCASGNCHVTKLLYMSHEAKDNNELILIKWFYTDMSGESHSLTTIMLSPDTKNWGPSTVTGRRFVERFAW